MWKLGVAPSMGFDAMLKDMVVDSYFNFKEQSTRNQDQAHKWGNLMLKVQERLDKVERDLNEVSDAQQDMHDIFKDFAAPKKESKTNKKDKQVKDEFSGLVLSDIDESSGKEVPTIITLEDLN